MVLIAPSAYGVLSVSFTGTIPRDVSAKGYFDLDVNILDVMPSNRGASLMFSRLTIIFPEVSTAGGEITEESIDFTVLERASAIEEMDDTTLHYNNTVFLRFYQGSSTFASLLENDKTLNLRMDYDDELTSGSQEFKGENVALELQTSIPNEAPVFDVLGLHRSLSLNINAFETITYTDEESLSPSGVTAIIVLNGAGNMTLQGYRHEPEADEDVAGAFCQFTETANGGDCITCGEDGVTDKNYYLDVLSLESNTRVNILELTNSNLSISFAGLDPSSNYSVFTLFRPDGAVLSSCAVVSPTVNFTLTELNGEPEAELSDLSCFIATAAYGSSMHGAVIILREFRDRFLQSNVVGRWMVEFYYQHSPPLAELIRQNKFLQWGTMALLSPLVLMASLANTLSVFQMSIALLLIGLVILKFIYRKKTLRLASL
jgi:hypothetical protein